MADELSIGVRSKNKVAKYVMLGCLGSSLIFYIAGMLATHYRGLIWMGTFICVIATVYFYNRYVGTEYCYSIHNYEDGGAIFVVAMKNGKTVRTMARLDLFAIKEVVKLSGKEYRAHRSERGVLKYSYFPTMCPSDLYLVKVRSHSEKADVFVEINEQIAAVLLTGSEYDEDTY